jgi:hypothetical protein
MSTLFWILAILVLVYFFWRIIALMIVGIAIAAWAAIIGFVALISVLAGEIDKKIRGK